MDYSKMLNKAMFDLENSIYNEMMMEAFDVGDNENDKAGFAFILALNRRGVSSKLIFEAFKEVGKELNKSDE